MCETEDREGCSCFALNSQYKSKVAELMKKSLCRALHFVFCYLKTHKNRCWVTKRCLRSTRKSIKIFLVIYLGKR